MRFDPQDVLSLALLCDRNTFGRLGVAIHQPGLWSVQVRADSNAPMRAPISGSRFTE
jgi:hypothetical protein